MDYKISDVTKALKKAGVAEISADEALTAAQPANTYAKRIIALVSKHFPTFATIAPLSYYRPNIPDYLTNGVFIAIDGSGAILGTAQKSYGNGITERVKRHENGSYTEVWHN